MKKYLGIILIIVFGLILRLICIDKPEGLWNDEYVSFIVAANPLTNGFIDSMKSQCHMPFYYLYLKFFMTIFGDNDIVLRLSSVFAGILSIIAMYFTGLEKNKKTAYLCAGMTAISSFLIYYSQEVRLYSVLFLFSALSLLFTLRTIKETNIKNIIFCALSNFLILFTHTIGFVFVFFNLIFLSINLFKQYKKAIITLWICIFAGGISLFPFILKIFLTKSFSQWWGHFSISKIGFLFTDYFSPVITNFTNAPDNFFYAGKLTILMLIPTLIAIFFIIKSLIKNKINTGLFLTAFSTVIILVIAAISGKLVFITKYSIEIYPILIYLACFGANEIKNKVLQILLISIFTVVNLGYLLFAPNSAPKIRHAEGHKIATDILSRTNIQNGDIILFEYYDKFRFEKYFDFSNYRIATINKGNFPTYLSDKHDYQDAYQNGKEIYKEIFLSEENKYFENKLNEEIYSQLKPGQSVVLVILNSVSFYNPEQLIQISSNDEIYKKEPLLFLVFSYIKKFTFLSMMKSLQLTYVEQKGQWTIVKFTKLNN